MMILVLKAIDLAIDESSFTGETEPSMKTVDMLSSTNIQSLSQRRNIGFMGTLVKSGYGKVFTNYEILRLVTVDVVR